MRTVALALLPAYREVCSGSSATRQSLRRGFSFTASTRAATCSSAVSGVSTTSGGMDHSSLRRGAVLRQVAGRRLLYLPRAGLRLQLPDAPVELVVLAQRGRVRELGQGADRHGPKLVIFVVVEHDPSGLGLEPVRSQRLQRDSS